MAHLSPSELKHSPKDDYNTLVAKNQALRQLLIETSSRIEELTKNRMDERNKMAEEKEVMHKKLDKIMQNYAKYAKSHYTLGLSLNRKFQSERKLYC